MELLRTIGPREAYPVILKGLKRLEYRGYDSAGVALLYNGLKVYKKKGKVADLEENLIARICMHMPASVIQDGQHMENPVIATRILIVRQW